MPTVAQQFAKMMFGQANFFVLLCLTIKKADRTQKSSPTQMAPIPTPKLMLGDLDNADIIPTILSSNVVTVWNHIIG